MINNLIQISYKVLDLTYFTNATNYNKLFNIISLSKILT